MHAEPMRWSTDELLAHAAGWSGLARRLVRDTAEAADVAQDTWLAALASPPERSRPVRPWLARVARNFARLHSRSEAARGARERNRPAPEPAPSSDELAERL